jgi:hypothetical protein
MLPTRRFKNKSRRMAAVKRQKQAVFGSNIESRPDVVPALDHRTVERFSRP